MTNTRKSGPMPEYTIPMFGQITEIFSNAESSTRIEGDFFSVRRTMPLVAFLLFFLGEKMKTGDVQRRVRGREKRWKRKDGTFDA